MQFKPGLILRFKLVSVTLLGLAGAVSPAWAAGGIRVVSDIDDTTKITNVGSTAAMVWNTLFASRSFAGMPEFYTALAAEKRGYKFEYLTAAPVVLKPNLKRFLKKNHFPAGGIYMRNTLRSEDVKDYKKRVVLSLMDQHPEDLFIFIGDDTQADFIAYDEVFQEKAPRILAIYIRRVTNRPLPPSAYPFLSAFDLARTEFLMGRLAVEEAAPVAKAILGAKKDSRIIPNFSYCPDADFRVSFNEQIEDWNDEILARIVKICAERD